MVNSRSGYGNKHRHLTRVTMIKTEPSSTKHDTLALALTRARRHAVGVAFVGLRPLLALAGNRGDAGRRGIVGGSRGNAPTRAHPRTVPPTRRLHLLLRSGSFRFATVFRTISLVSRPANFLAHLFHLTPTYWAHGKTDYRSTFKISPAWPGSN